MSALERLRNDPEVAAALDVLTERLTAADLRSALLAVAESRAGRVDAPALLRQYRDDRFVAPATIDALTLAEATAAMLWEAADADVPFEPVGLSPVAPLATSSLVSQVPQNNVLTTMRLNEVVADPTNSLALEAAERRRRSGDDDVVRLVTAHRVLRTQTFEGPRSFAHFSLMGLVAAGRRGRGRSFEIDELVRQIATLVDAVRALLPDVGISVRLTDFDEIDGLVDQVRSRVLSECAGPLVCLIDPDRTHGRGYYEHLCFKLSIDDDGEPVEIGDGGSVPWMRELLGNKRERLVISGIGMDRLIMVAAS